MRQRSPVDVLACAATAWIHSEQSPGPSRRRRQPGRAQNAANHHELPASVQLGHEETLRELGVTSSGGREPVGAAAAVLKQHMARENRNPPLTLLPELAEGKVSPDMARAMAMTDRTNATREEIFEEPDDRARPQRDHCSRITGTQRGHRFRPRTWQLADVLVDTELEEQGTGSADRRISAQQA